MTNDAGKWRSHWSLYGVHTICEPISGALDPSEVVILDTDHCLGRLYILSPAVLWYKGLDIVVYLYWLFIIGPFPMSTFLFFYTWWRECILNNVGSSDVYFKVLCTWELNSSEISSAMTHSNRKHSMNNPPQGYQSSETLLFLGTCIVYCSDIMLFRIFEDGQPPHMKWWTLEIGIFTLTSPIMPGSRHHLIHPRPAWPEEYSLNHARQQF